MVRWCRFALPALCAIAALSARPVVAQDRSAGRPEDVRAVPGAGGPDAGTAGLDRPGLPICVALRSPSVRCATPAPAWRTSPAAPGPGRPSTASGLDLPADVQVCRYVLNPNTARMAFWLQGSLFGAMAGGIGAVTFVALRWLLAAVLGAAERGFRRRSGGRAPVSAVRGR